MMIIDLFFQTLFSVSWLLYTYIHVAELKSEVPQDGQGFLFCVEVLASIPFVQFNHPHPYIILSYVVFSFLLLLCNMHLE